MKQLSSYIENLQSQRFISPCNLQFYIKIKQNNGNDNNNTLRPIRIFLKENDIRQVVLHLLKSCDLPTDYVDKIPVHKNKTDNFQINFDNLRKVDPLHGPIIMQEEIKKKREQLTLCEWLEENYTIAREKSHDSKPIRDEILRLKQAILDTWQVLEVKWDCGWNETQFRGCLQSFYALAEQHPVSMNILKGKVLRGFISICLKFDFNIEIPIYLQEEFSYLDNLLELVWTVTLCCIPVRFETTGCT